MSQFPAKQDLQAAKTGRTAYLLETLAIVILAALAAYAAAG
jgi:hypothetical protein